MKSNVLFAPVLALACLAAPAASAQDREREFTGTESSCIYEVREESVAMRLSGSSDGSGKIQFLFAFEVDDPGTERDGYFNMTRTNVTNGPVRYDTGLDGDYAQGYTAEMPAADVAWLLAQSPRELAYSISGTAFRLAIKTGADVPEMAEFKACLANFGADGS